MNASWEGGQILNQLEFETAIRKEFFYGQKLYGDSILFELDKPAKDSSYFILYLLTGEVAELWR